MARPGRRPGTTQTRQTIVDAAGRLFTDQGYDATTIRAVARAAEVDPALVYHYFVDKPGLFVTTFHLPIDPRQVAHAASSEGGSGANIVEQFLAQWEQAPEEPGARFRAMAQAVAASPQVARSLREFLTARVWMAPDGMDVNEWERRRALVSAQLVGVAWARYVLQVEPLASTPREQVARWIGPTLDRYRRGQLDT